MSQGGCPQWYFWNGSSNLDIDGSTDAGDGLHGSDDSPSVVGEVPHNGHHGGGVEPCAIVVGYPGKERNLHTSQTEQGKPCDAPPAASGPRPPLSPMFPSRMSPTCHSEALRYPAPAAQRPRKPIRFTPIPTSRVSLSSERTRGGRQLVRQRENQEHQRGIPANGVGDTACLTLVLACHTCGSSRRRVPI